MVGEVPETPAEVRERIGRGGSRATPDEVDAAKSHLVSTAAQKLRYLSGDNNGELFFADQIQLVEGVDQMMKLLLPLSKHELHRDPRSSEHEPSAYDFELAGSVLDGVIDEFETIVLATIYCNGWKIGWLRSFLMLILGSYTRCSDLHLKAVKGGPETDMEIRTIEELMWLLGFTVVEDEDGAIWRHYNDVYHRTDWSWTIDRPNAHKFTVWLNQSDTVEKVSQDFVAWSFRPARENVFAPNLKRIAVVSCPLFGPDDNGGFTKPIHDELNHRLVKALEVFAATCKRVGFVCSSHWQKNHCRPQPVIVASPGELACAPNDDRLCRMCGAYVPP